MNIPIPAGILMVLTASLMWGSWFQFVRRIGNWPVPSFLLWLYTTSFVIIWGAVFALQKWFIPEGIIQAIKAAPGLCIFVIVCGALSAVSMQLHMTVVNKAGLIFSTSVSAMFSIPYSFVISSYFGGIPDTLSLPLLFLGVALVFAAGLLCQYSTRLRDRDRGIRYEKGDRSRLKYMVMILICVFCFGPAYTLAMSIGTRTSLRPDGLPPVLLIGMLSTGGFLGTWIISGIRLTKNHLWGETVAFRNRRYISYACISGLFHYGGNMIHTIAIPALSMVIAWPLGNLASFWQYLWGVAQGEYKGAARTARVIFAAGAACYILALVILTAALYT